MKKYNELSLIEPVFSTYHHQIASCGIIANNLSIYNYFLNKCVRLVCNEKFLSGFTTPELTISHSQYECNPYLDVCHYDLDPSPCKVNTLIRKLIDSGYYIYYNNIDDYYINEKTWFNEKHFLHDGIICGYDEDKKQYCLFAYDKGWVLRKFWIPQKSFSKALKSSKSKEKKSCFWALKPTENTVELDMAMILQGLEKHLGLNPKKYPTPNDGNVRGVIVHHYIAIYLDKLNSGEIPHERMDWRIFRVLWEHKKLMQERLQIVEKALELNNDSSRKYEKVVAKANNLRMLYAAYHMRPKANTIASLRSGVLSIKEDESEILTEFTEKMKGKLKNETLELY